VRTSAGGFQPGHHGAMDCFASLAMTFEWNRLFLGVAYATLGAKRWI
jgi:hypothetical protein